MCIRQSRPGRHALATDSCGSQMVRPGSKILSASTSACFRDAYRRGIDRLRGATALGRKSRIRNILCRPQAFLRTEIRGDLWNFFITH
jgi:hypothetical protein